MCAMPPKSPFCGKIVEPEILPLDTYFAEIKSESYGSKVFFSNRSFAGRDDCPRGLGGDVGFHVESTELQHDMKYLNRLPGMREQRLEITFQSESFSPY